MSTGRYFIMAGGRKFCVEPVLQRNEKLDDGVFRNGGISGDGIKSVTRGGSVPEDESVITRENGYQYITTLPPGHSPNGYIEYLVRTGKHVGE
jgi:hypothetical protein